MKNILLGVTGSIAAYKAAEIVRLLVKKNISVRVIMTANAERFITPLTFETLTNHRAYTGMFDGVVYEDIRHISLAKWADMVLIAPATANIIGKLASGVADDMLSTVLAAMPPMIRGKPALICPAMNTAMWENPVVQGNVEKLKMYGYRFVAPSESALACGDSGRGALAGVDTIVNTALSLLEDSGQNA